VSAVEERAWNLRYGPDGRHLGPARGAADDWISRWAVRQLVGEAVMDHEIRDAAEPGPIDRPEDAIRSLVGRVTDAVAISEEEVRAYYARNVDRYRFPERRRVRYIALPNRTDAVRAGRRLMAGGTATSGADGYDDMELQRGDYAGAFEAAVFAARIGDLVGPVRTEHGWLVARLDQITAATTVSFEVARPAITHELLEVARARAFDDWLEQRRLELGLIAPEYEHPAHPLHGQPRHRH
jgi:hypothetical protein